MANYQFIPLPKEKEDLKKEIMKTYHFTELFSEILAHRVGSMTEANHYLNRFELSSPDLLPGATQAAHVIKKEIELNHRILIWGDYDPDGETASATLYKALTRLGAKVQVFVPNREKDGYGLNTKSLREKLDDFDCLITVDNGIAHHEQVEMVMNAEKTVVVTDHHTIPETGAPKCHAVVHPCLNGNSNDLQYMSGVGVAFKLAEALSEAFGHNRNEMHDLLDIVAIGTVADVVPLLGENRAIVRLGLNQINSGNASVGVKALKTALKQIAQKKELKAGDIAFYIAPAINAAGRLNQEQSAVKLLITENEMVAKRYADYLKGLNEIRKTMTSDADATAEAEVEKQMQVDGPIIIVDPNIPEGIIGLTAGRIAEKTGRPTFVFTEAHGGLKGSARSIPGLNLYNSLVPVKQKMGESMFYGGHEQAAGISIKADFDTVLATIRESVTDAMKHVKGTDAIVLIDGLVSSAAITAQLINELRLLEPCGEANPAPLFAVDAEILEKNSFKEGKHLSFNLGTSESKNIRGVLFNTPDTDEFLPGNIKRFIFTPDNDNFRNQISYIIRGIV